jgi:4-hydroxy-tetrahydrodipicolinate synthase
MRCEGSIVALVTPFTEEGRVDKHAFCLLIERQIEAGTDAIVICGTTGETPTLSDEEQSELLLEGIQIAEGRVPIIAGTGSYSTADTIEKTRFAKQAGAAACLVISPYYNRPTPVGIYKHIEAVAAVGLPIIFYHNPVRTGSRLSASDLLHLLSMDGVIALKESSGEIDLFLQLVHYSQKPILTGDDLHTLSFMAVGAKGIISVIANVIPKEWKEMVGLCLRGDFLAAREIFYRFYPLCKSMTLETNPQCVKFALGLMGLCRSEMRLPLVEPTEANQEKIRDAMLALFSTLSAIA